MGKSTDNQQAHAKKEFSFFIVVRILGGLLLTVALVWGAMKLLNILSLNNIQSQQPPKTSNMPNTNTKIAQMGQSKTASPASISKSISKSTSKNFPATSRTIKPQKKTTGVALISAIIQPIDYELNHRFWGWRPNDAIQLTDNINELQLGVLEVVRQATTRLTQNVSRTGSNAVLNKYLEAAMNAFMIRADSLMIPSAESSYNYAIKNLRLYEEELIKGEASLYTRPDNLVPMLGFMESLVGSCAENLVKTVEDNNEPVSTFTADNYYYYAKGVAMALLPILRAVKIDFGNVLSTRSSGSGGVLDHAITECRRAAEMKPWLFVTEGSLNGVIANHRANMATAISHTRFYLDLLVVSLST